MGPFFRPQPTTISEVLFVQNHNQHENCGSFHPFQFNWMRASDDCLLREATDNTICSTNALDFDRSRVTFTLFALRIDDFLLSSQYRRRCAGWEHSDLAIKVQICDRYRGREKGRHAPKACGKKPKILESGTGIAHNLSPTATENPRNLHSLQFRELSIVPAAYESLFALRFAD
jgi:hypothetical protein